MSDQKPDGPYVYQPFGMKERAHWDAEPKRVYAVGGMDPLATVNGLTKYEAQTIVAALRATGGAYVVGIDLAAPVPRDRTVRMVYLACCLCSGGPQDAHGVEACPMKCSCHTGNHAGTSVTYETKETP